MPRIRCFPLAVAARSTAALVLAPTVARAQTDYETTRIAGWRLPVPLGGAQRLLHRDPGRHRRRGPGLPEAATQYAGDPARGPPALRSWKSSTATKDADHATGAPALMREMGQEVPILAHRNAVASLATAGNADLPVPTNTYQEFMSIAPGDRQIELHYVGANHTDNSTVVFVPDVAVAFAVDFVANDREKRGGQLGLRRPLVTRPGAVQLEPGASAHRRRGEREDARRQSVLDRG